MKSLPTSIATISAVALLAMASSSAASAQDRPSWTGRDVAATAYPIRTTDLYGRPVTPISGERIERIPGDPYGYRPARSIYVDPYGNVTTFVGEPPAWLQERLYGYSGSTPAERYDAGQQNQPRVNPCVTSGGPATASSAIARAPNASGGGC